MRTVLLTLFAVAAAITAQPQTKFVIKGVVVQDKTNEPIAGASVFVTNSSRGTMSQADGSFELLDVPPGRHQLIISYIGYSTMVIPYTSEDLPMQLEVRMKRKPVELDPVTIEPDEANGWEKWGQFFIENFIGTSTNAADCKLKNPQALRFRFSRKKNTLTVVADEPLIIENRALGYELQYQLEEFTFDFQTRYLIYLGYPLFRDMDAKNRAKGKWDRSREKAYYGSMMHFMKSLYDNRLEQEGYEVRRLQKEENREKKRIRSQMQASIEAQRKSGQKPVVNFGDSAEYARNILRQPDEFDIILPQILTADSLVAATGKEEKTLFFTDYLSVIYKHEREEPEYVRPGIGRPGRPANHQRSIIFLRGSGPVSIDSRGHYSPILEIISYGYWAWSEKIANLLPVDYEVKLSAWHPRN